MKFTLSWLKDHLDTDASVDEIARTLNAIGLEVEGIEDRGAALASFRIARVIEAVQHPNADRLRHLRVDIGDGRFAIEEELDLFADASMGSNSADIRKQFGSLKFGQPSLLRLQSGEVLAVCWSFENSQYIIKGYRLAL